MQNLLIIFGAKYLIYIMIVIAVVAFILLPRENQIKAAITAAFVLPLSFVLARTLSFFFYNPRPFVVEKISPLLEHAADNGFPSDHTLLASALAAVVFLFNKKNGALLCILTIIIGLSRVLAKVHHSLDVFGSIAIVILVTVAVEKFILPKFKK